MTQRSTQTVVRPQKSTGSGSSRRRSRAARSTRLLVVPALAAFGALAAACSSSSNPSSTPASSANALITQGLAAQQHGSTQEAIKDFNAAAAKNPSSATAYYDLGVLYQENLNNPTQAAAEYNKALLASPNYKPAMYNLAIIDTKSDPQSAISLYNKLLALNPKDATVLFNLGLLLLGQNDPVQGHADLKQAIALNPSLASRVPAGITP